MPPRRLPVSVTRYEYLEGEAYDTDIYYTSVDTESPYLANTFTYRINSMSFNALFDQNGSPIVYPPVKETLPDGSYTLYRYSSFAQYSDSLPEIYTPYAAGMMHEPPSYSSRTYLPRTSYAWQRGLLLEQSLYSADGDPAGLLQPPERSGEHHVSRNQWSAHGLPADGRSQRSAESVQRTESKQDRSSPEVAVRYSNPLNVNGPETASFAVSQQPISSWIAFSPKELSVSGTRRSYYCTVAYSNSDTLFNIDYRSYCGGTSQLNSVGASGSNRIRF